MGDWAKKINLLRVNYAFARGHENLRRKRKILYALTPPPRLKNIGDHAQMIAIRAWLRKHLPEFPVIEANKDQVINCLWALKWLVRPGDIIFLQSGGNLGDRGIWSEIGRRLLIGHFKRNRIISLPQTIYFSDTPAGHKEREMSRRIYAHHPDLTLIARDRRSEEIAEELFPRAVIHSAPDFVLSLPAPHASGARETSKILLCLRSDNESVLTQGQKDQIIKQCPFEPLLFDTVLPNPIRGAETEMILKQSLELFSSVRAVITDRLHALIFAVLCGKPCVVLPSVDHKITAGMEWFQDIPSVALAQNAGQIPDLLEKCLAAESRPAPDWNGKYFDPLARTLRAGLGL